ncbi:RNA polymerase sigma factor [Streptomyces hydrogenans]|uniref:RNA polymerase sigma factor n=1 Tax=Streptomyces hydrogenans TaxID=1873719 RepID=UPI0035E1BFB5
MWVSDVELDIDAALDAEREAGRVLGKLSPQQRRLILLAEGWEYTHAEIAQITGLNRGTVATHIRRAKIALTIGAAVAAVIVTVLINWLPRGSTRPRWYDIGSAPWLGGPTLAVPVLAFAAFLAAAALIYFFEYRRIARRSVERARHTEVLNLMINTTGELAARRPHMAPTPADYAAHLGIPEEWITLDTLYHGDTRQPPRHTDRPPVRVRRRPGRRHHRRQHPQPHRLRPRHVLPLKHPLRPHLRPRLRRRRSRRSTVTMSAPGCAEGRGTSGAGPCHADTAPVPLPW